ncbi:MAG: chloride channel protein [Clostridia bacterium]|nr:chloride channel protein [Clostridia bacterium]
MHNIYKNIVVPSAKYFLAFFKWVLISAAIGVLGGILGSLFHKCIDHVTELRGEHPWILYLLPIAGLIIAAAYHAAKKYGNIDTNRVLESTGSDKNIPFVTVPLIFFSTVLTHMFGGSAGREGAALQLGGGMAYGVGKILRLSRGDMHTAVLAGMSAVFAALFGTPLTAAFFALEVVNVGMMRYSALVPCIVSALSAYGISLSLGVSPVRFDVAIPNITVSLTIRALFLAVLCAVLSIIFCIAVEEGKFVFRRFFSNRFLRIFAGGTAVVLLTLAVGTYDYNGAGMDIAARALSGKALPSAFALKILFTAISIGSGFTGGEIVPSFFIGATFGCTVAPVLGLEPAFAAAVGFIALFCGAVNCPVASTLLAFEVFGGDGLMIFAPVCAVSYMMSGNFSLYTSQKFMYSKISEQYLGQDISV